MDRIMELIEDHIDLLKERDETANKGSFGKLLVIGGSRGMAGAALLSALGAFRTGIGMVRVFGPECNRVILQTGLPESMYTVSDRPDGRIDTQALIRCIEWADCVTAGSGLSREPGAAELVKLLFSDEIRALLASKKMLILDADALNIIADLGLEPGMLCPRTVITPHIGEMSRLTGLPIAEIKKDQAGTAVSYSRTHHVTVVLKDHVTAVAVRSPEAVYMVRSGCGAMAKAGSGDVLCGFIAGITAVLGWDLAAAVPVAVYLHGTAGCIAAERKGCHSILAGDIADAAGEALGRL